MATNMIQLPIQPPIYPNTGSLPSGATPGSQAVVLSSPPTIYIYDGSTWVLVTEGGAGEVTSVTSAGFGLTASPTTGDVILTLAQSVATNSTPTYASINLTNSPTLNYIWTCTNATTGAGSWQVNAAMGTGVTSIAGTANQITASAATGAVTLSTPQNLDTAADFRIGTLGVNTAKFSSTALSISQALTFAIQTQGTLTSGGIVGIQTGLTYNHSSGSGFGFYSFIANDSATLSGTATSGNYVGFLASQSINSTRTFSNYAGFWGKALTVASGPTVTQAFSAYFEDQGTGTTKGALYAANGTFGYVVTPPTSGIVVNGIAGFGTNSPTTNNQVQITTALAHGLQINGTQTAVDGVSHTHALNANGIYAPTSGATLVSTFEASATFQIPTGQTVTSAASFHSGPTFTSNLGTITSMYGYWFDGGGSLPGGTIGSYYGGYFTTPVATATNKMALYSDTLSVGYASFTPSAGQLAVSGRATFGTSTIPGGSSASQVTVSASSIPEIIFAATGAGTNMKYWAFGSNSTTTNNTFFGYAWDDAFGGTSNWIQVQRTANLATIQYVRFPVGSTMIGSTSNPVNKLDVNGSMAVGSYAATNSAQSNGLIVSGNSGFGNVGASNIGVYFGHGITVSTTTDVYELRVTNTFVYNSGATNSTSTGILIQNAATVNSGASLTNQWGLYVDALTSSGTGTLPPNSYGIYAKKPTGGSTVNAAGYFENIIVGSSNVTTAPPTNGIITQAFRMNTSPTNGYVLHCDGNGLASWAPAGSGTDTQINYKITATKTGNYTAATSDTMIPVDTTSGSVTITLPTSSAGKGYLIVDVGNNASVNNILIVGTVGYTINGSASSYHLSTNYGVAYLYCLGTSGPTNLWSATKAVP